MQLTTSNFDAQSVTDGMLLKNHLNQSIAAVVGRPCPCVARHKLDSLIRLFCPFVAIGTIQHTNVLLVGSGESCTSMATTWLFDSYHRVVVSE